MKHLLMISIKPKYVKEILEGRKSIELRKSLPQNVSIDDYVVIYSTYPEKAIVGYCRIDKFVKKSPQKLWDKFSDRLGISKKEFFDYYGDYPMAIGIELKNIEKLDHSISLEEIKSKVPKFSPPQTYKYFNIKKIFSMFRDELIKNKLELKMR